MLRLPDAWIWDFWFADTGAEYHVFFLRASRALLDPFRRHLRASVGHAVSTDLRSWTVLPDALVASDGPAWDDRAIWTGSIVTGPDGLWRMFYTGIAHASAVQRIGVATSTDLVVWTNAARPSLVADPRWYETLSTGEHPDEFWRDPWVFADPGGDGWHMLITARGKHGALEDRGVVGHAWSPDLRDWEVRPPLSEGGNGFSQLEVMQTAVVDGQPVLVFSCLGPETSELWRVTAPHGGVWALACDSLTGPFDVSRAHLLLDDQHYVGRLIQDREGRWQLLAFHNRESDGTFDGRLSDPMPLRWAKPGVLAVD